VSKKKQRLSMEEHKAAGEMLKLHTEQLIHLLVQIDNAYSRSGEYSGRAIRHLDKAIKALSIVRCNLEEEMAKDFPAEWETSVYYGQR
jgi:hypothetical protein